MTTKGSEQVFTRSLLLVVLAICLPATTQAQPTQQHQGIAEVHALIANVERLPAFSAQALENLLGITLTSPETPPDPGDLQAILPLGTFSEISYREMGAKGGRRRWHVSIGIRRDVAIPIDAIDRQFKGRHRTVSDGAYESISTRSMERPGGLLHFQYGITSRTLQAIIFVREGSPERADAEARFVRSTRQAAEFASLLGKIQQLSQFSRPAFEALFGAAMSPSKGDPPGVRSWEASLAAGVVEKIRYREIAPSEVAATWVLSLDLRKDLSIPSSFIDPDLITTRAGFRVRPDFDTSDVLRALTFTREGSPIRTGGTRSR